MQTIGERLEEARKKKGISIREAAEATKIRGDYLQKFESNHFDIGLTEIYTRGFLRTYSNFLKLPADRILNDYAALGRAEVRPRQPSREVYGRMDITVATAEAEERSGAEEPAAPPEPSAANRGPQRSRAATSLPTGPDPAVVFKYLKWGGAAIILLLLVLIIKSLLGGRPATPPSTATNPSAAVQRERTFNLIALNPVRVSVHLVGPDNLNDGELLFDGTVSPGQPKTVRWPAAVFIETPNYENLRLEVNGQQFPIGVPRGRLDPPAAR